MSCEKLKKILQRDEHHFPKNMQTCCFTGQQKRPASKAVWTEQTAFNNERKPGVNNTITMSERTFLTFFRRKSLRGTTGIEHITEVSYLELDLLKTQRTVTG